MRVLKRGERPRPSVSIVLLDWSVRESFHLLHYLRHQTIGRDAFEVLLIEYYSRTSAAAASYAEEIDTWVLLEAPEDAYYHKHLMYNVGIALASGDVCVFCDSDAMVESTFVETIATEFSRDPAIVLHLDQFRNLRRDLYPFCFPSFADVIGPGCINNAGGRTRGLADSQDPLHERNYGACMCARRADLIAIGGADEHIDYLGHICGPYEMTFRLVNSGRREVWQPSEFMYHTWHPGQAGVGNYLGPHDGRHMSTTALDALATGRVRPYVENRGIQRLREGGAGDVTSLLVDCERMRGWTLSAATELAAEAAATRTVLYRGFKVERDGGRFAARLLLSDVVDVPVTERVCGDTLNEVQNRIDGLLGGRVRAASLGGALYVMAWRALSAGRLVAGRGAVKLLRAPGRLARAAIGGIRRLDARRRQFLLERRFLSGALGSLLVNLHFFGRALRAAPGEMPRPIVLVERRAVANYLRLAGAVGLITPFDVVRIRESAEVERWVRTLAEASSGGHVIVGRDFYVRHYAALSRLRALKRLVVA